MRLYDANIGLFTSPDPLWGTQLGNSAYHYGYNSPLLFSDPTGLMPDVFERADPYSATSRNFGKRHIFSDGTYGSGWWLSHSAGLGKAALATYEYEHTMVLFFGEGGGGGGGGSSRKTASTPAVISPFWRILQRVLPHLLKHANENLTLNSLQIRYFWQKLTYDPDNLKPGDKVVVSLEEVLESGSKPFKNNNMTLIGHALEKHSKRLPSGHLTWGRVVGHQSTWHDQALPHIHDIMGDQLAIFTAKPNEDGRIFLERQLMDGRGIRLNRNKSFKGLIDEVRP